MTSYNDIKNHPLLIGCTVLLDVEVNPNEVVKMFSKLILILTPRQTRVVRKIQKNYADEHGITRYQ